MSRIAIRSLAGAAAAVLAGFVMGALALGPAADADVVPASPVAPRAGGDPTPEARVVDGPVVRPSGARSVGRVADASAEASLQETEAETWAGAIEVPGQPLEFSVTFRTAEGGGHTATIDIPAQGADDLALTDVVYGEEEVSFALSVPGNPVWSGTRSEDGATVEGEFTQGGMTFPFRMERAEAGADTGMARPQTPRPPFPYETEEVAYENPADGTELAGTLTVPAGAGPHPAVLLITGSGAQDRDETILGHKPFLVLADHLTRAGVAVLRVDDRGVGGSTGNVASSTSADLVGDVLAGVEHLAGREEIDAGRIGLIGHSEGGIIAPMAAARSDDVAFLVLLAGTGLPGMEMMPLQLAAVQRAVGRSEENIERQLAAQRQVHELVVDGAPRREVREAVAELTRIQLEENAGAASLDDPAMQAGLDQATAGVMSPWYRHFLANDPREWLRQVDVPVLALNGSLDLQVPAEVNLQAIEDAVRAGGNDAVETRELPGLNHLLQTAITGSPAEYGAISETMSPVALQAITDWIRRQTGIS